MLKQLTEIPGLVNSLERESTSSGGAVVSMNL